MHDFVYRQLARLLVQRRGAYGVELARRRAVASRLMGDEAEYRDWTIVEHDAELLLRSEHHHQEIAPPPLDQVRLALPESAKP